MNYSIYENENENGNENENENENYDSDAETVVLSDTDSAETNYNSNRKVYDIDQYPTIAEILDFPRTDIETKANELILHFSKLSNSNGPVKVYIVGGFPRDIILNRRSQINDIDIVMFNISKEDVKSELDKLNFSYDKNTFLIDKGIFMGDQIDISTSRIISSWNIFKYAYPKTLHDDVISRDSTLNSLFFDPITKHIYDPCNAITDIKDKVIRTNLMNKEPRNLRYLYSQRPWLFIRLIRYSITLNMTIDKSIWEVIHSIRRCQLLSIGLSEELEKKMRKDKCFNKLIKIFRQKNLARFLKPSIQKNWGLN